MATSPPSQSQLQLQMQSQSQPQSQSQALVRKSTDTRLMPPPPPPKRIKRPPVVLDEDSYTDALSEIIARDFFPGLLEVKHQQEYLDALESHDPEWIAEASSKLATVMTPGFREQQRRVGRRKSRSGISVKGTGFTSSTSGWAAAGLVTPTPTGSSRLRETPASVRSAGTNTSASSTFVLGKVKPDTSLSLDAFQAKYTSEDNASFNNILDQQNEKRRNAYAWMWNGNKIPGKRVELVQKLIKAREVEAEGEEEVGQGEGEIKSIGWIDDRKAAPETWKSKPRNGLMFVPEGVEESHPHLALPAAAQPDGEGSNPSTVLNNKPQTKSIASGNTRFPTSSATGEAPPPSPTFSAIQDAIAGFPRASISSVLENGNSTPRINGYAFVDDEPSNFEFDAVAQLFSKPKPIGGEAPTVPERGPWPFKIAAPPRRELLLNKMVDKVAREKRASTVLGNAAKAVGGVASSTPGTQMQTPLTPAGHKLLSSIGVASAGGQGAGSTRGFAKAAGQVSVVRRTSRADTPRGGMGTPAGFLGKRGVTMKVTQKK